MRHTGIATGLSYGARPDPRHAEVAVRQALEAAGVARAGAVLLFLTPEYARQPEPAIRAAARAAGCMQVIGCTGAGVLTEQEWVLDSPGAAAMVFGGEVGLKPLAHPAANQVVASFCTPAGLSAEWLEAPVRRIGAVSADLLGQGPFKVWSGARIVDGGRAEAALTHVDHALAVSQGIRALTSPIEVAEVQGYDLLRLGNYPALNVLVTSLPNGVREMERIPLHLIMGGVTFGDPGTAIHDGRYRLNHIVSADLHNRSITLSHPLHPGERLFWAMRDALIAERDMGITIERAQTTLGAKPDFALLFPCTGRGPSFYGNRDRDIDLLKSRFPKLPFIGIYGNGEIGPLDDGNHLHQYSTVLGLFRAQP